MKSGNRSRVVVFTSLVGIILAMAATVYVPTGDAKTLGMVAAGLNFFESPPRGSVTVFDADTNEVLGTVIIPAETWVGDVVITSDQARGFVAGFDTPFVYVIDLTTSPPSLAGGTNPITLSHNGLDMALSVDDKFLLVAGGAQAPYPISVVDLATLAEINTFSTGDYANAIDVCDDGSVLVTSPNLGGVSLFRMDATGSVVNLGQQPFVGYPINVYCARGSKSGVVVDGGLGNVDSFALPGLAQVGTVPLSTAPGDSGVISPAGDRVYIRSDLFPPGSTTTIDGFEYDATTGTIGGAPLFTIPIQGQWQLNGVDQLAINSGGSKLYVGQPGALNIYDAGNGTLLGTITDPNIVDPAGVAIAHLRAAPSITKDQCKHGGWATFHFPRTFKNEGDCIQFVDTGK